MNPAATSSSARSRESALADFVGRRVGALQASFLRGESRAVASLARLRRAITAQPGADPLVWAETLADFPENLQGRRDEVSRHERAAHAAVTLYALHQQSQSQPMHSSGQTFGGAVRLLGVKIGNDEAVLRRFHTVATASSMAETLHHARGLITQLRGASIPLDYATFAVNLSELQRPTRADRVRLVWGREYYRDRRSDTQPAAASAHGRT